MEIMERAALKMRIAQSRLLGLGFRVEGVPNPMGGQASLLHAVSNMLGKC